MANQFREAVIPRLTEVVGRGGVVRGTCPTRNRRGTCPGVVVRGDLSGGTCPGVDVLHSLVTPVEFNFYELHSSSLFLISISDAYRQTRCVLNERHLRSLFFFKRALKTLSSSTRNKQTNVVH